jgi:SAM-dependent methyltransferase
VKTINNYVKSCLLDVAVRAQAADALGVADVACGRGQDFPKWMHACHNAGKRLTRFYAMDLADTYAAHAADMMKKFIDPVADTARFVTGDMSIGFPGVDDNSIDVLSCQLCVHYVCDRVERLRGFLKECARVLTPNGILLLSYADGRSIVRRGRDALTERPRPGYDVRVQGKNDLYSITIPSVHLQQRIPSPFGCRYVFHMMDTVESLPEYLCHEGALCGLATKLGFTLGPSMAFDVAARVFERSSFHLQAIGQKMHCIFTTDKDAMEAANLYRFSVFTKGASTLRRWEVAFGSELGVINTATEMTGTPCPPNLETSFRKKPKF